MSHRTEENLDQAFKLWMRSVDMVLEGITGLCSLDLPDWSYRDSFDGGDSPRAAAKGALRAADYPNGMF